MSKSANQKYIAILVFIIIFDVFSPPSHSENLNENKSSHTCKNEAIKMGVLKSDTKKLCGEVKHLWPVRCFVQMKKPINGQVIEYSKRINFCSLANNVFRVRCYEELKKPIDGKLPTNKKILHFCVTANDLKSANCYKRNMLKIGINKALLRCKE